MRAPEEHTPPAPILANVEHGQGAARFGEAETRRRSLRQPPVAAGAAPRSAPSHRTQKANRPHSAGGRVDIVFFGQRLAAVGTEITPLPPQMLAAVGAAQHGKVKGGGGKPQQDHCAAEEKIVAEGKQHGAYQHGDDLPIEQAACCGKGQLFHGVISSQKFGSEGQHASSL